MKKVVLNVITITLMSTVHCQESCHLPSGNPGLCVDIASCSHITKLISNLQKPFPSDVSLLIRDSFLCGSKSGSVQVCCPEDGLLSPAPDQDLSSQETRGSCAMQRDQPAQCVTYNQCSPFVQLLVNIKKPLDPVVPRMIRSSYLCGVDESEQSNLPKVCCPTAALTASSQTPPTPNPNKFNNHPGLRFIADKNICGKSTLTHTRIVGGNEAPLGKFPWLVNLGYQQDGKGEKLFKCGGTLIGPRHIVTAAHCVTGLPPGFLLTTIRLGEHDLDKDLDCEGCPQPQDISVEKIDFHESYGKPEAFQNDIAVVKLTQNVTTNDFVIPICLPWNDDNENYVDGARSGASSPITEVAGWGATTPTGRRPANVLQYLDVSVTNSEDCKEIYKTRGGILNEKQICAGGVKGKVSQLI